MSVSLEPLRTRSRFELALPPDTLTASADGASFDLLDCDGPVQALVSVGEVGEELTLAVAFQQSETGSSWSNISGSSVPDLAADSVVLHTFLRTMRYLRCQVTLAGDSPTVTLGVLVGQACKVF